MAWRPRFISPAVYNRSRHGGGDRCPDITHTQAPARGVVGRRIHGVSGGNAEAETGNRILDVGCGEGLAEVAIGRLQISQVRLVGVDLVFSKVLAAHHETASHNQRVQFAAADACRFHFATAFDSLYSVAVLQHVSDVEAAVAEMARVTMPRGRVVAVEPDNSARYGFSSTPAGAAPSSWRFRSSTRCLDSSPIAARPRSVRTCPACFLNVVSSRSTSGSSSSRRRCSDLRMPACGKSRRDVVDRALRSGASDAARWLGREYLETLTAYEAEATSRDRRSSRSSTPCSLPPWDRRPTNQVTKPSSPNPEAQSQKFSASDPEATKAGTTTRRSMTGRMRGRSANAMCRSGGISPAIVAAPFWSSVVGQVASLCLWGERAYRSLASIGRVPCSSAHARACYRARLASRVRLIRGDIRFLPFESGDQHEGSRRMTAAGKRTKADSRWCSRPTDFCSRSCAIAI